MTFLIIIDDMVQSKTSPLLKLAQDWIDKILFLLTFQSIKYKAELAIKLNLVP